MDRAVERMWKSFTHWPLATAAAERLGPLWPEIDMAEDDKAIRLTIDIPGMEAKDLDIEVSGNLLTISGSRQEEKHEGDGGARRHERHFGSFSRTLTLPTYTEPDKVDAKYDKGVLTVTVPKVPGKGPTKVAVKAGG
jgi:HSP20 family protein